MTDPSHQPHPMTDLLRVRIGQFTWQARLERETAPKTCAAFEQLLPFTSHLLQARWSGDAGWVPLGSLDIGVRYECPRADPRPGQVLWHPSGLSEAELLVPYGVTRFASQYGPLTGNHFMTLLASPAELAELGPLLLWNGAQAIEISRE